MRWKLISLSAALIAVTSAQLSTIENSIVIQPHNFSSNEEDQNSTVADYLGHDNSSYNSDKKDELPLTDSRAVSASLMENEESDNADPPNNSSTEELESKSQEDTPETTENSQTEEPTTEEGSTPTPGSETTESNEVTPDSSDGTPPIGVPSTEGGTTSQDSSVEGPSSEEEDTKESADFIPPTGVPSAEGGVSSQGSSLELTSTEEEEVQTTHGPVKGYQWTGNPDIMAFYDIPYGKFQHPFETPVTAQSWIDIHKETKHTKVCPQFVNDVNIGETDCLTLSIFKSKDADNASVLFYVYDGYGHSTSADPLTYGPDNLVPRGVILVLPNYRIGPMGFLCMQNETALGNAGLKDLSLALEWVKDNIHWFGGNPSNIVVSGDGAAGAYAGYLAICSRSESYINKVITESGSALSHWALDRNPIETANKLADRIRNVHSDGVVFNNTFAEVELSTILKAAKGMRFKPCIEYNKEPFIDDTPWKILHSKKIDTTFMIGSASYAGTHEATDATPDFFAEINENFNLLLPDDLVFLTDVERNEFAQKLRKLYFGEDNITVSDVEELSLWYTDASYLSPGVRLARPLLAAGATVYLYEFAFVGSLNRELEALEALHKIVSGAIRGDLVGYLFHKDGTSVEEDSPETRMIQLMVDLWISFIDNGKPAAASVEWNELKKAEDDEEEWLLINSEPQPKKGIHVERLRLWTSLYNQHFIDSSGLRLGPHYLALAAALMCLITNNKLNYSSQ